MARDTAESAGRGGARCPICRRPTTQEWRPFCSRRCADLDLGRWMTGAYAIPTEDTVEDESETGE